MALRPFRHTWLNPFSTSWTRTRDRRRRQLSLACLVAPLEGRAVPSTIVVSPSAPDGAPGSLRAANPPGWSRMLVFEKPTVGCGLIGNHKPWLANWEPIFVLGEWPEQTPTRSAVIATRASAASGYSGYATRAGHSHAKPLDVMEQLIDACPAGVVADPFAGSGSTLIAARNLGHKAIGVEVVERYCELIAARLAQGGTSAAPRTAARLTQGGTSAAPT